MAAHTRAGNGQEMQKTDFSARDADVSFPEVSDRQDELFLQSRRSACGEQRKSGKKPALCG